MGILFESVLAAMGIISMTLIDQEIRVIRSIDLAWRPRGAINRTPDETEKQTKNTRRCQIQCEIQVASQ